MSEPSEPTGTGEPSEATGTAQLLINGALVDAAETRPVVDPATGEPFTEAPFASTANADAAVAAARAASPGWAATDIEARADLLRAWADRIEADADVVAAVLSREQGKPIAAAKGELAGTTGWLRATAVLRLETKRLDHRAGRVVEITHRPLGVVVSITPWNFPALIPIWHVAPALLTGNTVVLKPSEHTPLTGLELARLAADVFPAGVINVVTGDRVIGEYLSTHPGVDKIVFTGSTPIGRRIAAAGAATLKRLTLELGGNDAAIVLPDVDLDEAAPKIFAKAFGNSGQVCAAIKRVYVHRSRHDELVERLADLAASKVVGPGDDPGSDYGPVQNAAQYEIVRTLAADAAERGARFAAGGVPDGDAGVAGGGRGGYFVPLSIVADVPADARLVVEEQFGPVLPLVNYDDVEEAVGLANDSENGLGGSVWGSDVAAAADIARRLAVGTSWVNDHATVDPLTPFGGARQSGIGSEFGASGLEEYVQRHVIDVVVPVTANSSRTERSESS